jgi:hypothetical protein
MKKGGAPSRVYADTARSVVQIGLMMGFLNQLRMRCPNWLVKLLQRIRRADTVSQVPRELTSAEVVTRILYSKKRFSIQLMRPKPNAFDPTPYSELSVIHVTGLSDPTIWEIAEKNTMRSAPGRNTIYARADVPVEQFRKQKLQAIRDDKPFNRHTSVVGWPPIADMNERKERWKEICLALSESPEVKLAIPPTPICLKMDGTDPSSKY